MTPSHGADTFLLHAVRAPVSDIASQLTSSTVQSWQLAGHQVTFPFTEFVLLNPHHPQIFPFRIRAYIQHHIRRHRHHIRDRIRPIHQVS